MNQPVVTLSRALDQAGDVLAAVHADDLDRPTPCGEWSVRDLANHLAAAPARFLQMSRGEEVDWAATPRISDGTWATTFRSGADDLIHYWHGQPEDQTGGAGWQIAEIAVHTWDLARAIKRDADLDDEVAATGLAFLEQGLTDENRGQVFAPAVSVPDDAPAYDRLAAFAGRTP